MPRLPRPPRPRLPVLLDAAWLLAFAAALGVWLGGPRGGGGAGGLSLELVAGTQRQGLYRGDARLGTVTREVRPEGPGWRVTQRLAVAGSEVARASLRLRRDLSLEHIEAEARLGALVARAGALAGLALPAGTGDVRLAGGCRLESGDCTLTGRVAGRRVQRVVTAGRGPVLPSAVLPLLARGRLGRVAEVAVFDPVAMARRTVRYEIAGRERIRLRSGREVAAIRVRQRAAGMASEIWLDPGGRVLRERLPLGLRLEHEGWGEAP